MNIDNAVKNLKRRGFEVSLFDTRADAADYLAANIKDTTVGIGGSVTVEELGLAPRLAENNEVVWHWLDNSPDVLERASKAKVYLASANGIAETGEIINIDGRGNRVAATLYGRDAVYIIAGINKLAATYDKALWRARNIASPKNAQRLGMNTPCAVKGDKCYDCSSADRICNELAVLWGKPLGIGKLEVVIIKENLGY